MTTLQPLLARNRYSDEEWAYASAGLCDWITESGMSPTVQRCGLPSDPESVYRWCAGHDGRARRDDPDVYGR